jgi:hypothetical protein
MKKPGSREKKPGFSALGGTRTPNLLIRSQMLYPLSYKREEEKMKACFRSVPTSDLPSLKGEDKRTSLVLLGGTLLPRQL